MQLIEMSVIARVSASAFESIARGLKPRVYGKVDPSSDAPIEPRPEPVLRREPAPGGAGDANNEGATLMNVVQLTESLFDRRRLPDELLNRALLRAMGVPLPAAATPADGADPRAELTDARMDAAVRMNAWWDNEADAQLVELATKVAQMSNTSPSELEPSLLLKTDPESQLSAFPVLLAEFQRQQAGLKAKRGIFDRLSGRGKKKKGEAGTPEDDPAFTIRLRFAVLQHFNVDLQRVVRMIDLLDTSSTWSIGYKVNALTERVFLDSKMRLLDKAVAETTRRGQSGLRVTLDNNKAFASQNRAERFDRDKDPAVSECLFVQLCKELNNKPPSQLQHSLDSKGRLFYVTFRGDEGTDWGGIYRETLARATSDLFASYFALNLPCPNRVHGQVDNADRFVPNPRQTSPSALAMFEFVGKLMGIALRTKNYLEIGYAPLVWKKLVGQKPNEGDLHAMDTPCMDYLRRIREWDDARTFERDLFDGEPPTFSIVGSDGVSVDLLAAGGVGGGGVAVGGSDGGGGGVAASRDAAAAKGGASKSSAEAPQSATLSPSNRLTFADRGEFVRRAIDYRLSEFDAQCDAIRRGLSSVVPQRALQLFTGVELEILVCGDARIEIEQLKKHATYQGWNKDAPGVQRFWRAFEKLNYKERSGLVRFAWGRSRLPKEEDWSTHGQPFKVTKKNGGDGAGYPLAHTCFFQLEVPEYSSDKVAEQKLRFCATVAAGMGFGFA